MSEIKIHTLSDISGKKIIPVDGTTVTASGEELGPVGHLQLECAPGARRIILLGFDQHGQHWHQEHPEAIRKPPNWPMWAERFSLLARDLAAVGVEVVNASRETSLTCFKRASLAEALRC
jgi:hypothetical protein